MKEHFRREFERVRISPLGNEAAPALRLICTHLGLATHCPANGCKRARACATRQGLCWQIRRCEINQLIQRILAHDWQGRVAKGENVDIAPAGVRTYIRILAQEKRERASAAGGTHDVSDTVASWSKGE